MRLLKMITGPGYSKDTAHSAACPKKFLQALVKPVKDSAGSWPRLTTYDRYGHPAVVQLSILTAAGNRTPIQGAAFFDFNQGVVHPSSPAATRQPMGCQPVNQGVVHPSSPAPTRQPMGCQPVNRGVVNPSLPQTNLRPGTWGGGWSDGPYPLNYSYR